MGGIASTVSAVTLGLIPVPMTGIRMMRIASDGTILSRLKSLSAIARPTGWLYTRIPVGMPR